MVKEYTLLALLSGACAALASVFAKLAFHNSLEDIVCYWFPASIGACTKVSILIRCVLVGLLLLSNVVMWTVFSKALALSAATVQVTVVNTASNFICSAIFGSVLFGESFSLMWFVGLSMMIAGLVIIHQAQQELSSPADHTKGE